MIAIVTDSSVLECGEAIHKSLVDSGADAAFVPLGGEEINPCRSCGGCETRKSFKRCVFRDGADAILPYIARSETLVIVTPLVYGGYSYQTKLVVDRLSFNSDFHYYVHGKELTKGKDPPNKKYYVIGISDGCNEKEAEVFQFLVTETLRITNWRGKAIIAQRACDAKSITSEVLKS